MEQHQALIPFVEAAYGAAGLLVALLVFASILRARRAKRTLALLESDHEA